MLGRDPSVTCRSLKRMSHASGGRVEGDVGNLVYRRCVGTSAGAKDDEQGHFATPEQFRWSFRVRKCMTPQPTRVSATLLSRL